MQDDRLAAGVLTPTARGGATQRAGFLVLLLLGLVVGSVLVRGAGAPPASQQPPGSISVAPDVAEDDAAGLDEAEGGTGQDPDPADAAATDGSGAPDQLDLGTAGTVRLLVPAVDALLVSFHEAAFPEALEVVPSGALVGNENASRFAAPSDTGGVPYHVQVSRGRANAPTSAVDVVLDEDTPVLSPVSGVVAEVRPYSLYGRYDDVRLELHPDTAPGMAVVLIHLRGVQVATGQRVVAGQLIADGARRFPFDAVVDRATAPAKHGHVHLEVKPIGAGADRT